MENEEKRGERDGGNRRRRKQERSGVKKKTTREREREKEALTVQNFLCGVIRSKRWRNDEDDAVDFFFNPKHLQLSEKIGQFGFLTKKLHFTYMYCVHTCVHYLSTLCTFLPQLTICIAVTVHSQPTRITMTR